LKLFYWGNVNIIMALPVRNPTLIPECGVWVLNVVRKCQNGRTDMIVQDPLGLGVPVFDFATRATSRGLFFGSKHGGTALNARVWWLRKPSTLYSEITRWFSVGNMTNIFHA
jgi:hypothetical protein